MVTGTIRKARSNGKLMSDFVRAAESKNVEIPKIKDGRLARPVKKCLRKFSFEFLCLGHELTLEVVVLLLKASLLSVEWNK